MIDNKKFRITNTRQFEQLADKFAKQIEWDNLSETDLKSLVEIIEMERDRQGVSYKEILDKWSEEGCSWLDSWYEKYKKRHIKMKLEESWDKEYKKQKQNRISCDRELEKTLREKISSNLKSRNPDIELLRELFKVLNIDFEVSPNIRIKASRYAEKIEKLKDEKFAEIKKLEKKNEEEKAKKLKKVPLHKRDKKTKETFANEIKKIDDIVDDEDFYLFEKIVCDTVRQDQIFFEGEWLDRDLANELIYEKKQKDMLKKILMIYEEIPDLIEGLLQKFEFEESDIEEMGKMDIEIKYNVR